MNKNGWRGSCLCGSITFQVHAFQPAIAHCHCSMCRKFHGAAFATIASVKKTEFTWTSGESDLQQFTADNGTRRSFCRHCGSSMIFYSPKGSDDMIEIAAGCLDDELPIPPLAHIFVESGVTWARPTDGLPCYTAGRNSPKLQEVSD